jgi:hypothetical protein
VTPAGAKSDVGRDLVYRLHGRGERRDQRRHLCGPSLIAVDRKRTFWRRNSIVLQNTASALRHVFFIPLCNMMRIVTHRWNTVWRSRVAKTAQLGNWPFLELLWEVRLEPAGNGWLRAEMMRVVMGGWLCGSKSRQ